MNSQQRLEEVPEIQDKFVSYIYELQDRICQTLAQLDGEETFHEDLWDRPGGGGGRTRVIQNGAVFEKGGVNVSVVHGALPEVIQQHFGVDQGWFLAAGLSLVIHPQSPMVPTVHANWRTFVLRETEHGPVNDAWFGGGADLTPYYLWEEDAVHFHQVHKTACDYYGPGIYPDFKAQCDQYFFNHHRGEARGIGGLFFDYLRPTESRSYSRTCDLVVDTAEAFLPAYVPIVERRRNEPWGEREAYFHQIRRGRYVEFNLIHDRGTLFGLKTGGRIESILMSLPPRVRWDYDFQVEPGSREAQLIETLSQPRDWVG